MGWTVPTIAEYLRVSKSSVSLWVRDIQLTPEAKEKIRLNRPKVKLSSETKELISLNMISRRHKELYVDNDGFRICGRCGKNLPLSDFYKRDNTYRSYCKECHKESCRQMWKSRRLKVFEKLGGAKCAECGCDVFEILEVNHINGGGTKEAMEKGNKKIFLDIIHDRVDISHYNVLCHVCNHKHYVEQLLGIKGHKVIWTSS